MAIGQALAGPLGGSRKLQRAVPIDSYRPRLRKAYKQFVIIGIKIRFTKGNAGKLGRSRRFYQFFTRQYGKPERFLYPSRSRE